MGSIPFRTRVMDVVASIGRQAVHDMTPEQLRLLRERPMRYVPPVTWVTGAVVDTVTISTRTIPVRDARTVGLRLYHPRHTSQDDGPGAADGLPVMVYLHGGGWVLGNVANYDPLCSFLADAAHVLVAGVEFRLAPENPAPAALEDCIDALTWLGAHARAIGGNPARLGVGGDSAGGNLATATAQGLRDTGGPALSHQVLLYPSVDSTCLTKSKIDYAWGPILRRRKTDAYLALYLGTGPDALPAEDPRVSPMLGRLDGLAPTLIQTAGLDPLRDEGLRYGEKLRRAGVPVVVTNYPFCAHGFASYPGAGRGGWAHRTEIAREVRRHLHGPRRSG